jgi:hypothetical protein
LFLSAACDRTQAPVTGKGSSNIQSPSHPFPAHVFAPYVDLTLDAPFALAKTAAVTGVKYYTLAFVNATESGGCQATWGGYTLIRQKYMLSEVNALRSGGGDVILSFGGANATELASACTDEAQLEIEYQSAIDAYNVTSLDFDIEGPKLSDRSANDRRNKVIAALQKKNELTVSYTLPAMPSGLTDEGINLLKSAAESKVKIATVNIMAMDYGESARPDKMGQNAIDAANKTIEQIQAIFPDRSAAEVRTMIGMTPMIGLNDTKQEIFTLSDAKLLLNYAKTNDVGRLAVWSITRDRPCPKPAGAASSVCSGIVQEPFAFSNILKEFTR